ncbi:hypothetical protein MEQU1_002202 [Malassezia equina]|uniref:Kelch repeat-containing protein n=1 Tax=Malassezia equina TaxID=1381935 RepID=A0AAF0IZ31_9BASI|nr:hypothetical protein MEQU1_002202 [Malassezia equina]
MGRFLPLVPYVAALIAAASPTLAAPAPTPTSTQASSSEDSGLMALFGTQLAGQLGEAYGAQHTQAPGTPQQDGSFAGNFMKMLGGLGQFEMPEPDMSRYSNATVAPRWGATAQYLQGSQTVVFMGGQLDDQGRMSNETLALDMSGLTNLQSTRASVKRVPWLHLEHGNHTAKAPKTAYASSYVSTSICGATDGHAVDTMWLVGGKTEQCEGEKHELYTYSLEKKNHTLVGTWKPVPTNGSHPTRRSHASAVLTRSLLPHQDDVALMVWGGKDVDAACKSNHKKAPYATSMDLLFIGNPLDEQCSAPKHYHNASQVQTFTMGPELRGVPVADYAAVQMPLIHNPHTHRDETPLLFLGGRDENRTLVDFAHPWAMDLSSGHWTQWATTGDIPSPRVGHSATHTNDGRVLVYGGYKMYHGHKNVSKVPTDEMYMLDASHTPARWTRIHYRSPPEDGPRPSKRAYHSAVMVDDVLVVAFGQQHESTAYGLVKRGGTNENASDPLVMYMDTRENIMGFRWTDKLSAIVSARVTQNILGAEATPTSATYLPTSTARTSSQGQAKPTSMTLPNLSRVPTPKESSASVSSASKASASKASASKASASKASASKASASQASSQAPAGPGAAAQDGSNRANSGEQDGSNHANGETQDSGNSGAQTGSSDASPATGNGNDAQAAQGRNDAGVSSSGHASSASSSSPSGTNENSQDSGNHSDNDRGQTSTSGGAIAGGVIGAAALAVGAVAGGLYAYKKRRESQKIAELKSNGVLYDKDNSAPPVSSLWLQRPLRDVIDYDVPGRSSNLSGYSIQGHVGTPASLSPAGGRLMGQDDRHAVRGPRSVYADPAFPEAAYSMDPSNPYATTMDDIYAHAYQSSPFDAELAPASSYGHMDGVQRSSGAEVTSNMGETNSMYANSVDGQTMVHGEDNVPRRSASFRFPDMQAHAPHEPSTLRVMNN